MVLVASAVDPDGDDVTVTVDWGDGNVDVGGGVIYRRRTTMNDSERNTIRIRAEDERGGFDTAEVEIEIEPPEIAEIDLAGLAWTRVTPTEGRYDGVPTFAIDSTGTIFTHNYMDLIRRSSDEGRTWETVLEDVECCGKIATRRAGEVIVASPGGLFSLVTMASRAVWSESKYRRSLCQPTRTSWSPQQRMSSVVLTSPVVWSISMNYPLPSKTRPVLLRRPRCIFHGEWSALDQ